MLGVGGAGCGDGKAVTGVLGAGTLGYTVPRAEEAPSRNCEDEEALLVILDCNVDIVLPPDPELDAVTGDDLTGDDLGETSSSSGLATNRPWTGIRFLAP